MGMKITAPTPTDRRAVALGEVTDSLLCYRHKQCFALSASYNIYIFNQRVFYGGFKQLPLLPVVGFSSFLNFFFLIFSLPHWVKPLQGEWSSKKKKRERE